MDDTTRERLAALKARRAAARTASSARGGSAAASEAEEASQPGPGVEADASRPAEAEEPVLEFETRNKVVWVWECLGAPSSRNGIGFF